MKAPKRKVKKQEADQALIVFGVTLAIRDGETYGLREDRPNMTGGQIFKAALIETIPLPGPQHPSSENFTAVVARKYVDGWGWVHLEAETKQVIAAMLKDNDFTPGVWYWLWVRPHRK